MADHFKIYGTVIGGEYEAFSQAITVRLLPEQHREGICQGLTIDWLANGGSMKFLGQVAQGRRAKNLAEVQEGDIVQMMQERGLTGTGHGFSYRSRSIGEIFEMVVSREGLYFVGLVEEDKDGRKGNGHAVGIRYSNNQLRAYDSNYGQMTFRKPNYLASFRMFLDGWLNYIYQTYTKAALIHVTLDTPMHQSFD